MKQDEFSDILNAQGFVSSASEQQQNRNTTLKQLQAKQDTDRGMDPIKIKVYQTFKRLPSRFSFLFLDNNNLFFYN